jgi:hypothetical protein
MRRAITFGMFMLILISVFTLKAISANGSTQHQIKNKTQLTNNTK